MGRGRCWSLAESRCLLQAWFVVSEDPIKGSDQTSKDFWDAVGDYYNTHQPRKGQQHVREVGALNRQWSKLRPALSKFAGFVKSVMDVDESGSTIEDKLQKAVEWYEKSQNVTDATDILSPRVWTFCAPTGV